MWLGCFTLKYNVFWILLLFFSWFYRNSDCLKYALNCNCSRWILNEHFNLDLKYSDFKQDYLNSHCIAEFLTTATVILNWTNGTSKLLFELKHRVIQLVEFLVSNNFWVVQLINSLKPNWYAIVFHKVIIIIPLLWNCRVFASTQQCKTATAWNFQSLSSFT